MRTFLCSEQFRVMAFAQPTCRESLSNIEACLSAQASKLCPMGTGGPVSRSTLAEANRSRDRQPAIFPHITSAYFSLSIGYNELIYK